jgi:hypothetical protein
MERLSNSDSTITKLWDHIIPRKPEDGDDTFSETSVWSKNYTVQSPGRPLYLSNIFINNRPKSCSKSREILRAVFSERSIERRIISSLSEFGCFWAFWELILLCSVQSWEPTVDVTNVFSVCSGGDSLGSSINGARSPSEAQKPSPNSH